MRRLFGTSGSSSRAPCTPSPAPASESSHAVESLADTLDILEKREAHVSRLIDREIASAQEHSAAHRQREALECMKRKRILEKELEVLRQNRMNVFKEQTTLSALKFNSIVVGAMKDGAAAIKREIDRVGGVDGTDQRQDGLDDLFADASELLEATARPLGDLAELDDAELLEELEQLELEDVTQKLGSTSAGREHAADAGSSSEPTPHFARVPQHGKAAAARAREERAAERELAELQALQSSMKLEQPMPMPMMAACF